MSVGIIIKLKKPFPCWKCGLSKQICSLQDVYIIGTFENLKKKKNIFCHTEEYLTYTATASIREPSAVCWYNKMVTIKSCIYSYVGFVLCLQQWLSSETKNKTKSVLPNKDL